MTRYVVLKTLKRERAFNSSRSVDISLTTQHFRFWPKLTICIFFEFPHTNPFSYTNHTHHLSSRLLSYLHPHNQTPPFHNYLSPLTHQSPSPFLPCIAICLALSASANPPAILPLLSLAPVSLTPLPLYPLSLLSGAGLRAAGRFAGGAGGFGLPFAGRTGGGGGAACSSR